MGRAILGLGVILAMGGLLVPPLSEDAGARTYGRIVLGGKAFGGDHGEGWGEVRPHTIYNGGDPSGLIMKVRWLSWGSETAIGWGRNPIFKPRGGYYRRPVAIKLKASRIGRCEGRRAYTRLSFREPSHPGGRLGPWRLWSGAATICHWPHAFGP
jgi:hypothetical protein